MSRWPAWPAHRRPTRFARRWEASPSPARWIGGSTSVDPIFCPALDTLHPIVPAFGGSGPRLGLTLADGKTRLRDGEHILPRLVMPDFRGNLRVDYVGA